MFILKFRVLNMYNFGVDYKYCDNEESVINFIEAQKKEHGDVFEVYSIHELGNEYKLVSKGFSLEKVCVDKEKNGTYCDICTLSKSFCIVHS